MFKLLYFEIFKKSYILTTSLWNWYFNCQKAAKFEIIYLYRSTKPDGKIEVEIKFAPMNLNLCPESQVFILLKSL